MSYNVPSYDKTRFSFGPGVLYMGAPGSTPLIEVGAVKGNAEISIERSMLEIKQGSPQVLVEQYVVAEQGNVKVTGIEWKLDNLAYVLGAGVTALNGAEETLEFGGDMAMADRAIRFVHRTPDGSTIDIHCFRVQGVGKIAVTLNETDTHEFPYEFKMLEGATDFTAQALADKKKLLKIIRTKA